ncbi:PEP/pyruvate-binding domain-containing protein [Mycolicibacterium sp. 050158]|uniref:PEP/pyruvate-binding domain-containing protein n=1 Tax=Mycolicibacterium sp. 050158 TaxID=3090602 RepID=UPI00299D94C1|nr:PEP/pyruvate-binding domain-containing protein [Mycolicibacterium sp. 050158]MDX1887987.1 PEP/pyruvate-binding domain-containing protein [Mycolicibacterium sp. 050158]
MTDLILWIDTPGTAGDPRLGGKFGSLAEMTEAGFQVPPGFGITTDGYRHFLAGSGLVEQARRTRENAVAADLATVERLAAEMAEAISTAPLPEDLEAAIRTAYAELSTRVGDGDVPVAVRSSGESEDLGGASFAGQYDTFLWVHGIDDVLTHVRRCWAGMFGSAVLTYRPTQTADLTDYGICVGIQQMVASRSAGVMFTLDPVTGDRSKVVIEGCWGLGEGVVSGAITPSRYVIDKVTFEQVSAEVAVQEQMFALDPTTSLTGLMDVLAHRRGEPCLSAEEIRSLVELAKRIEQHRGAPQDIEWAIAENGDVRVLQVRPETVWSNRVTEQLVAAPATAISQVLARFAGVGVTRSSGAPGA